MGEGEGKGGSQHTSVSHLDIFLFCGVDGGGWGSFQPVRGGGRGRRTGDDESGHAAVGGPREGDLPTAHDLLNSLVAILLYSSRRRPQTGAASRAKGIEGRGVPLKKKTETGVEFTKAPCE